MSIKLVQDSPRLRQAIDTVLAANGYAERSTPTRPGRSTLTERGRGYSSSEYNGMFKITIISNENSTTVKIGCPYKDTMIGSTAVVNGSVFDVPVWESEGLPETGEISFLLKFTASIDSDGNNRESSVKIIQCNVEDIDSLDKEAGTVVYYELGRVVVQDGGATIYQWHLTGRAFIYWFFQCTNTMV